MIKTYSFLLLICIVIACLLSNCDYNKSTQTKTNSPEDTLVQIPNEWIEKLKALKDYKNPPKALVTTFDSYLYSSKTLIDDDSTQSIDLFKKPYLNPLFVNLDESPENELLLWIGSKAAISFAIIKKINSQWYLLYETFAGGLSITPNLRIDNTSPNRKIFYTNSFRGHGAGFHREFLNIFRIENNRVLVDQKFLLGSVNTMGNLLSHQINNIYLAFHELESLSITYRFNFSFGIDSYQYLKDTTQKIDHNTLFGKPFLRGEESFYFKWDTLAKQYLLADTTQQKKFEVLTQPNSAAQFCEAFKPALDTLKRKGGTNPYTKEIVEALYIMARKEVHHPDTLLIWTSPSPSYYETRSKK